MAAARSSRALWAGLTGGKSLLHFAPEACLEAQFRRFPGLDYHSADLYNRRAMHKIDITHIPLQDDSFDFVYCSHVLEHVPDDRQALAELQRVLRPGGQALILVPVKGEMTAEDPTRDRSIGARTAFSGSSTTCAPMGWISSSGWRRQDFRCGYGGRTTWGWGSRSCGGWGCTRRMWCSRGGKNSPTNPR